MQSISHLSFLHTFCRAFLRRIQAALSAHPLKIGHMFIWTYLLGTVHTTNSWCVYYFSWNTLYIPSPSLKEQPLRERKKSSNVNNEHLHMAGHCWENPQLKTFSPIIVHPNTVGYCLNLLAPELFFFNFSTPVYKMWIIQEPNKLELWNKLHFKEKKTESTHHV